MLAQLAEWLCDTEGLTPRGAGLMREPALLWLHAASDLATGIAFLCIAIALAIFVRRRTDLRARWLIRLFAAFVLLSGLGHLADTATLWLPAPAMEVLLKAATALASLATAAMLWRLLPRALAWPTPDQLRKAEAKLSEARQRITFDLSPVPKHVQDLEGRILDVSESWLTMLGRRREEVVGRPVHEVQPPGSASWSVAEREKLAAGELQQREMRFLHRDGMVVEALVSARAETPGEGRIICAVVDITDRKRAEAALRSTEDRLQQSQKMEAIGRLAAGVAHDFNNILQAVVGALEAVMDEVEEGTPARQFAAIALRAAGRGSSLTQHLLSYARKQLLHPRAIELGPFLEDMRRLLQRTLGPHIEISVQVERGASVLADPGQLGTALLNLAINSADAMRGGGLLRIDAYALEEDGQCWTMIAVTDTGTGMDSATLARAVDPFFTTKGVRGTGLGLSMVQGFAEQSGGRLNLLSAPGEGTTVELSLPGTPPRPAEPERVEPRLTPGRVLLVDDAPDVLLTTGVFLQHAGFTVLRAEGGRQALELLASEAAVDVLVTDYAMPGMNGAELVARAREIQPGLPALVITGFADTGYDGALPGDAPVLRKPFQRKALTAALAKLMPQEAVAGQGGSERPACRHAPPSPAEVRGEGDVAGPTPACAS